MEKFWEILRNFGRFCHNLHAFMWRKIEPKKYICGEKWQIWGLITCCRTVVQARKSISILFFSWRAFASSIKKISEKALFNGQYEQKVRYAMLCEEILGVCMNFSDQFVQCVFRKFVAYLQVQFEPGLQGDWAPIVHYLNMKTSSSSSSKVGSGSGPA